mgnify:CR=1 FL=1
MGLIINIESDVIISIIGSLRSAKLGFLQALPGKYITKELQRPLEIVSAQGTIATFKNEIAFHIHILVSYENHAVRGYLNEVKIFGTAEVVIAQLGQQIFRRFDYTDLKKLED